MKEFAIVIVTYNRLNSVKRLLNSLNYAYYLNDKVDLIISIDYSGSDIIYNYVKDYTWDFGEKKVISHTKNLGLRNHILLCGNFTSEYSNICVLEDDIYVSPLFYIYSKQASKFYENCNEVAGISLYNHLWNYISDRPFYPLDDGSDIYFMQQAQSWGQIWNKRNWCEFKNWYDNHQNIDLESNNFPSIISNWPKSSWLKYHMKYLVENNKFFVYPRVSLSTNFSDVGTHNQIESTCYQVPLQMGKDKNYNFANFIDSTNKYDIYFENINLTHLNRFKDYQNDLTIDLYGLKKIHGRYLLSTKVLNFKILESYALKLRPHELNVYYNIKGNSIFLYDTQNNSTNKLNLRMNQFLYDIKLTNKRLILKNVLTLYKLTISNKVKTIFKNAF